MGANCPDIVLSGHTNDVNSCDYSANGLLVTSSSDKTVRVWSRQSTPPPDRWVELAYSPLSYHGYSVHCVRFSPGGATFVSCSTDGTAVVWNAKTGVTVSTLRHPSQSPLRACGFSPDGSLIATGGDDGDICVWSAEQPRVLLTLRGHEETVACVSFSGADSGLLVSGCLGGDLRLWHPRAGQAASLALQQAAHDLGVTCCHFQPQPPHTNGVGTELLASGGNDCTVRLWTVLPDGGGLAPLTSLSMHTGAVMAVHFSPDGRQLASAGGDKTVRLWDTDGWSLGRTMHGHTRYVTCCCFSGDGRLLVSGSNDKTVQLRRVDETAGSDRAPVPTASAPPLPQAGDWGSEEVGAWLRSLGLAQYSTVFAERAVDGARLLQLTEEELLTDLAVELVGHRNKLVRQIERLRQGPAPASAGTPPADEFYCPITRELMTEPVVCSDGYSYERAAITAWLKERTSSPMTNEPLAAVVLVPNHALRSLIGQWRLQHGC